MTRTIKKNNKTLVDLYQHNNFSVNKGPYKVTEKIKQILRNRDYYN